MKLVSDNGVVVARGKQLYTLEIGHSDLNPTTRLAPPAFPTMSKSAAQLDRAAVAYRAAEANPTPPTRLHAQGTELDFRPLQQEP